MTAKRFEDIKKETCHVSSYEPHQVRRLISVRKKALMEGFSWREI